MARGIRIPANATPGFAIEIKPDTELGLAMVVAEDEDLTRGYLPAGRVVQRRSGLAIEDIGLVELDAVDIHGVIMNLHQIAGHAHDTLDERDVLTALLEALWRLEHDHVTAVVVVP